MSESVKANIMASAEEVRSGPKRPYHKPAVRYERVFETRALVCGKTSATQYACIHQRKTS